MPGVKKQLDVATKLYGLYKEAKNQENSLDYIDELIDQLSFFGTETNKLTKEHVRDRLLSVLDSINKSLEK